MSAYEKVEDEIDEVVAKLKRDRDAVDPAVATQKDRKQVAAIAVSSVKLNFILGPALVLSLLTNSYLAWNVTHVQPEYFASDNGRIFPMVPLSAPYRKTADVIQFAKDTLNGSFSLDFLNWRQQLEDQRQRYTRSGFKSFIDAIQAAGLLENVRTKRMNMTVTANTGVLIKEGIDNGQYVWFVEVPIEIKLAGQTSELPNQRFLAIVRVERIPTLDSIEGIGVGQLVTKPL
ncbi:DotI/IcmL/TraM family protein [Pseudomonas asuensis]|uniref:Conjugal transfer protein TraM n=1 Tax=Pseudomonas asuensis TaxID=1825787 RepID=A0ABQ2H2L7_9PSED|nr:DotI/IcmL/TraM family protein [Pseudomonas asuensis]GGM26043.1 conjugal transfer protein TraM [Pseudomonas asuensis]